MYKFSYWLKNLYLDYQVHLRAHHYSALPWPTLPWATLPWPTLPFVPWIPSYSYLTDALALCTQVSLQRELQTYLWCEWLVWCQGLQLPSAVRSSFYTSRDGYSDRYRRETSEATANFGQRDLSFEFSGRGGTDVRNARLASHSQDRSPFIEFIQHKMDSSFSSVNNSRSPPGYSPVRLQVFFVVSS